jgi:hypothetical protein
MLRRIEAEMAAPRRPCLIEDEGKRIDPVAFARGAIGGEHEVVAFQHPQPRPPCCLREGGDGQRLSIGGNGPPGAGQEGDAYRREDERPRPHGRRV